MDDVIVTGKFRFKQTIDADPEYLLIHPYVLAKILNNLPNDGIVDVYKRKDEIEIVAEVGKDIINDGPSVVSQELLRLASK
jgi:hypothetical protein